MLASTSPNSSPRPRQPRRGLKAKSPPHPCPSLAGRVPACTPEPFDGRGACSANSPSHPARGEGIKEHTPSLEGRGQGEGEGFGFWGLLISPFHAALAWSFRAEQRGAACLSPAHLWNQMKAGRVLRRPPASSRLREAEGRHSWVAFLWLLSLAKQRK